MLLDVYEELSKHGFCNDEQLLGNTSGHVLDKENETNNRLNCKGASGLS